MNFLTDNSIMHGGDGIEIFARKHLVVAFLLAILSFGLIILYNTLVDERVPKELRDIRDEDKETSLWWRWGHLFGTGILFFVLWIIGFKSGGSFVGGIIALFIIGVQTGLCLSLANPTDLAKLKDKYNYLKK